MVGTLGIFAYKHLHLLKTQILESNLIYCCILAQSVTQSCSAPRLDGGLFDPKQEIYSHGTKLTYTCNDGRKPAAQGWWATSTCENGSWSPQPQCIGKCSLNTSALFWLHVKVKSACLLYWCLINCL